MGENPLCKLKVPHWRMTRLFPRSIWVKACVVVLRLCAGLPMPYEGAETACLAPPCPSSSPCLSTINPCFLLDVGTAHSKMYNLENNMKHSPMSSRLHPWCPQDEGSASQDCLSAETESPALLFSHPRLFCLSSSILLFLLEMYLVSQCHSEPSKFPNLLGEPGQEQWERQLSTLQPVNPKSSLRTLSDARTLPFSFLLPSFLPSSPSPSFSATPSSLSFPLTDLLSFSSN